MSKCLGMLRGGGAAALFLTLGIGSAAWAADAKTADRDLLYPPTGEVSASAGRVVSSSASVDGREVRQTFVLNAARYGDGGNLHGPLSIRLYDDAPEVLALRDRFAAVLVEQGATVWASSAPVSLSFEVSNDVSGALLEDGRSVMDVWGQMASHQDPELAARVSAAQVEPPPSFRPMIRLQVSLADTTKGRRLWEGWVTGPIVGKGQQETLEALVPALVAAMGQTVRRQAVTVAVPDAQVVR